MADDLADLLARHYGPDSKSPSDIHALLNPAGHYQPGQRLSDDVGDRRGASNPLWVTLAALLSKAGLERNSEYMEALGRYLSGQPQLESSRPYDPGGLTYPVDPSGPLPGPRDDGPQRMGILDELEAYYGPKAVHRYNNTSWYRLPTQIDILHQLNTLPSRTGLPFPPDPNKP